MWHRYIDDVFVIWPHGDQHLNGLNPLITFMIEKETEGKIAFLDVQLEKKGTKVHTSVFHKRTHMDRYLNFDSHPARVKRDIIQCLRHRAEKVCDGSMKWQETLEKCLSEHKNTVKKHDSNNGIAAHA